VTAFAGNDALVNLEYKTKLYDGGLIPSAVPLLDMVDRMSLAPRLAAAALASMATLPAAQDALGATGAMRKLTALLARPDSLLLISATRCIARAARNHVANRQVLLEAGAVEALTALLSAEPVAEMAKLGTDGLPERPKTGIENVADWEERDLRTRRKEHTDRQAARWAVEVQAPPTPYTLHHTPYTLHLTPYTLHPTRYTLHHITYTLNPEPPQTLNPQAGWRGGRARRASRVRPVPEDV